MPVAFVPAAPRSTERGCQGGTGVMNDQRAAIYCRVSSVGQEDNFSLETQEAACREFALAQGLLVSEANMYREVHTGNDLAERTRLSALRAAARRGEVDVVIAHGVDRLSRNQAHLYILADEWE